MKKAAKILCIIAMIIGLIWAVVGFFGTWIGGAVVGAVQETVENSESANATMEKSVSIMLRLLGSFVVVIIANLKYSSPFSAIGISFLLKWYALVYCNAKLLIVSKEYLDGETASFFIFSFIGAIPA